MCVECGVGRRDKGEELLVECDQQLGGDSFIESGPCAEALRVEEERCLIKEGAVWVHDQEHQRA